MTYFVNHPAICILFLLQYMCLLPFQVLSLDHTLIVILNLLISLNINGFNDIKAVVLHARWTFFQLINQIY